MINLNSVFCSINHNITTMKSRIKIHMLFLSMIFLISCRSKNEDHQPQIISDSATSTKVMSKTADSTMQALIQAPEELEFVPLDPHNKERKGVLVHVLFGDLHKKGPVAFLTRLPNGFSAGWHSHSSDCYLTVIKGTYHEWCRGEVDGKPLVAGGTIFMPANKEHNNRAESDPQDGYTLNYAYYPNGFDYYSNGVDVKK